MKYSTPVLYGLIILSTALIGCGDQNAAPCKVSGSLSYNGQPIKSAKMFFQAADGTQFPAAVSTDGTYFANDLPAGEYVVLVDTEPFKAAKGSKPSQYEGKYKTNQQSREPPGGVSAAGPSEPKEFYIKIPGKYANANTSTVSTTLKPGRKVFNIDLTD